MCEAADRKKRRERERERKKVSKEERGSRGKGQMRRVTGHDKEKLKNRTE